NITYIHSNKELLFSNINLNIQSQSKVALIGNNGVGKSTMLKIMSGMLQPQEGRMSVRHKPYYIPQLTSSCDGQTIAEVLFMADKLKAITEIGAGEVSETNMALLEDDWTIVERCQAAFSSWQLEGLDLGRKMDTLSGGQKIKVFLAGVFIHNPRIILMDEPSNHLDEQGRGRLYDFIQSSTATLVVVSHDRALLNMLDTVYELHKEGIMTYGGNYDFYVAQKHVESEALHQDIQVKEKALRKAKEVEKKTMERQQRLDSRGKKKQEKAGLPTISMKTFKNNAEKSTARAKDVHTEKIAHLAQDLAVLRKERSQLEVMKFVFNDSSLHKGKILITATDVNLKHGSSMLWSDGLNIKIVGGDRVAVKGLNGSGKTTLIRLLIGHIQPEVGIVHRSLNHILYIDQDYSLLEDEYSVYEQAQRYNATGLHEHEIKIRLHRFLFSKLHWDKPCAVLSGGEKMRLLLCCLSISSTTPQLIVMDEPTNNLDLQNIKILTNAIKDYDGTLLMISHDTHFLEQIGVTYTIDL
ncbi:MAG TPA: ABC-F family ATP-binding cassette domain-containing protein, partial [Cytophagales bacterium]|nr:ABC-F family ATP-binding cassette domain-containing protein [Cytophagales bacterium]